MAACAALMLSGMLPGCLQVGSRQTLADLHARQPDLEDARVDHGLSQAMEGYRKFLEEAPESSLTPEAMRRLADLQLEQAYGALSHPGGGADAPVEGTNRLPLPEAGPALAENRLADGQGKGTGEHPSTARAESREDFERRAAATPLVPTLSKADPPRNDQALAGLDPSMTTGGGPLEAIALYDRILATYPDYAHADQVLYQKARAFDELGRVDESVAVASRLIARYPASRHVDELLFRRGEYHFVRKKFMDAETSYAQIVSMGPGSEYYELALYKLGWSFYKQMMLEEALRSYVALLDYKVESGYDFGQIEDEADAQRVSDTYRVTSLCFSELGGPPAVRAFFSSEGSRPYEDRIYRQLGEFYLEKLRYADAASAYETFVDLYPNHARSPHFSVRVIEIYEAGDFPQLVLEAKESFVTRYAVTAAYWLHFDLDTEEEVVGHLKRNLDDLAQHFHARFQQAEDEEERDQDFVRSERWYRQYLGSFGDAPETPALHDRFADLLFEYGRFVESAEQYERVAYDYPPHEQSASAGYAAVFARREALSRSAETEAAAARSGVIESSLRFAEAFPAHEHAAPVLAAAVEDLYVLGDYARTIEVGRGMLAAYPAASPDVLQSAWLTVAHASFDSERYGEAEEAYGRALALSEDESGRAEIADNLAAAVYKQGEFAKSQGDARAAADHFLRVSAVAPSSAIGAVAEYDAAAALIEIEDWSTAAGVLEDFRDANPDHELQAEATRQVAFVYESAGDPGRAATEYERVAEEADTEDLRGEALLHAGELHEEAGNPQQAVTVYGLYVTEFTHPIDVSVATRFKMAQLHEQMGDEASRRAQLKAIVAIDARAGTERTPLVRSHAARSALFLAEPVYAQFADLRLTLPFERSLRRKREQMAKVLSSFEALVDYGVGEVTAGATYYIAETYDDFSRSLRESERPSDLSEAELMDYEDVLEEEAFPFEERAISVHEKNLELISAGVWSEWIEKSLGRLAERSPGRFARREQSAGPLRSIDHYVYRSPRAEADAELQVAVDEQPTGDDGSIGTEPSTPSSVPEKSEAVQPLSPPAAPAPGAAAGGDGAEPSFEGVR